MKKQITLIGCSFLIVAALLLMAASQQEKNHKGNNGNKGNKEQQQDHGKQGKSDKENKAKNNRDDYRDDDRNDERGNDRKENKFNKGKNDEFGKDNKYANKNRNENNNRVNYQKDYALYGYNWDRENFKNRKKIKNQEKVSICHKFNSGAESAVTIKVSANAAKAHLNHGDIMGECPVVAGNRYSNTYLSNRTNYYNTLQNSQEQITYSSSILDYALSRLTNSRLQLATMQNNNMPLADIQNKQAAVVDLEQNVSLLETLLGVAVNIVASKLQ
ncbi:MAG TPA: hypothetical protein VLR49_06575 [Ferruginibacter sp.]|nr:hypothetical protein [Ferruginibacter sp.]